MLSCCLSIRETAALPRSRRPNHYYERVYLGTEKILSAAAEKLKFAHYLRIARERRTFGDVDATPFPTDAELVSGVQVSLEFNASLQEVLEGTGYAPEFDYRRRIVIENLIIQIVTVEGRRYFQVQQLLPEADSNGSRVREILMGKEMFGIGADKSPINTVEGSH